MSCARKLNIRTEAKKLFPPSNYELSYKMWEATVENIIDDIHASQLASTYHAKKAIFQKFFDIDNKSETLSICKEKIELLNSKKYLTDSFLHKMVRKHYRRGYTNVNNQIVLHPTSYKVMGRVDGYVWLRISLIGIKNYIYVPFKLGTTNIIGRIRLIIKFDALELHYCHTQLKKKKVVGERLGIDKGLSEVFVDSNGNFYGTDFSANIQSKAEERTKINRHRGKLFAIRNKALKSGKIQKAANLEQNNLGRIKQDKKTRKQRNNINTLIRTETYKIYASSPVVVVERLSDTMTINANASRKVKRLLSEWMRGSVQEAIEEISIRCNGQFIEVNPAYTSQIDHRNGTLLGKRIGDKFMTFDGIVLQADHNGAINIKQRAFDKDITIYISKTQVLKVVMERTDALLSQMNMTRKQAVERGWLQPKFLN